MLTLPHDRHAVIADGAAKENLVAGAGAVGRDFNCVRHHANARGGDEYLIALAAVDHFGVASDKLDIRCVGGVAHRLDDEKQTG